MWTTAVDKSDRKKARGKLWKLKDRLWNSKRKERGRAMKKRGWGADKSGKTGGLFNSMERLLRREKVRTLRCDIS